MSLITSRQNPLIKKAQKIALDPRERRVTGLFLGDGLKLLEDAVRANISLVSVIVTPEVADEVASLPALPPLSVVPEAIMRVISPAKTPQGVCFLAKQPAPLPLPLSPSPQKGQFLLLDTLQDPGNIGSILRSAEAFGFAGVLLRRCADAFSPKALRGGMGAQFRLPLCAVETLENLGDLPLWVADTKGEPLSTLPPKTDCIVALGNEGNGLSADIRARAGVRFTIPMTGGAESLGVAAAAAIVCYALSRS